MINILFKVKLGIYYKNKQKIVNKNHLYIIKV